MCFVVICFKNLEILHPHCRLALRNTFSEFHFVRTRSWRTLSVWQPMSSLILFEAYFNFYDLIVYYETEFQQVRLLEPISLFTNYISIILFSKFLFV